MQIEKGGVRMKKLLLILSIIFVILTFVGAIYVLINKGTVNAGYAVVPMVMALACSNSYKAFKNKENDSKPTE